MALNIVNTESRRRLAVIVAVGLVTLIVFGIVVRLPHDRGDVKGTIPDEWSYYDWGQIYMEGRLAIPLEELAASGSGSFLAEERFIYPDIYYFYYDGDGSKADDDLYVSVTYGGAGIPGMSVSVDGKVIGTTGEEGTLVGYNITGGRILEAHGNWKGSFYFNQVSLAQPSALNYYLIPYATDVDIIGEGQTTGQTEFTFKGAVTSVRVTQGNTTSTYPLNGGKLALNVESLPIGITPLGSGSCTVSAGDAVLGTYNAGEELIYNGTVRARVTLKVIDSVGNPAPNVGIYVDGILLDGKTDSEGTYTFELEMGRGIHRVEAVRDGMKMDNMMAGVSEVDGKYYLVNHWPPGYSFVIGAMSLVGLDWAVILIFLLSSVYAVYFVAEDLYGPLAGIVSSMVWLLSPLAVNMTFSRYMGDYPTAATALVGFALLYFAMKRYRNHKWKGYALLVLSGLMFSAATTMRYSTGVALSGPAVVFVAEFYTVLKDEITKKKPFHETKKIVLMGVAFSVGVLLLVLPLLHYNTVYFGGPFNSGYQLENRIVLSAPTDNGTSDDLSPEKSFVEQKFVISEDDYQSLPRKLSLLYYMAPFLFLGVLGALYGRRRWEFALLAWGLAVFIVYFTQGWAGCWTNEARSIEDMRYFLPALAPMAVTAGAPFKHIRLSCPSITRLKPLVPLAVVILLLLAYTSVAVAGHAITLQLERTDTMRPPKGGEGPGGFPGPGGGEPQDTADYIDVSIEQLLGDPVKYDGKGVHVTGLKVYSVVREDMYIVDDSGRLYLFTEKDVKPPETGTFQAWGHFRPAFVNKDRDPSGAWEIHIAPGTTDRLETETGGARSGYNIQVIMPQPDSVIPPGDIRFVVKTIPPAENVTFRFNGEEVQGNPGKYDGDFVAEWHVTSGSIRMEVIAIWPDGEVKKMTVEYTVSGDSSGTGGGLPQPPSGPGAPGTAPRPMQPGSGEQTTYELYNPPSLRGAFLATTLMVLLYLTALIITVRVDWDIKKVIGRDKKL